jgi:DNA-binding transcriptional LysR family regulator
MKLSQIRYFLALCETLNFTRAAERCGVSQPALTQGVGKLEQELGGLLIQRERRPTRLTQLGLLMRPVLEQVLAREDIVRTLADRFPQVGGNPMRLGIMPSVGPLVLAPFLARFGLERPDIQVTVLEGSSRELKEMLVDGRLDAVLAARLGPADGRLHHFGLYRERVVVVFPVGHRFAQKEAVRLIDLKKENFLLRTNCEKLPTVLDNCRRQGFQPNVVYRSNREDWIQTIVAAGWGVTLMPENMHLGKGTLARPLIEPTLHRDVFVFTLARTLDDCRVPELVRAIRAYSWGDRQASTLDIGLPTWMEPSQSKHLRVTVPAHIDC